MGQKADFNRFRPPPKIMDAVTFEMSNTNYVNDPMTHRHTANLTGLEPGTTYLFSVVRVPMKLVRAIRVHNRPGEDRTVFVRLHGRCSKRVPTLATMITGAFRKRPDARFTSWPVTSWIAAMTSTTGTTCSTTREMCTTSAHSSLPSATTKFRAANRRPICSCSTSPRMVLKKSNRKCYTFKYSNAEFFILDTPCRRTSNTNGLRKY